MESVAYDIWQLIWMLIIFCTVGLYYLPTYKAFKINHQSKIEIFIFNTLWFLIIPYIIALYLLNKKYE